MNILTLFLSTSAWILGQGLFFDSIPTQNHSLSHRTSSGYFTPPHTRMPKQTKDTGDLISIPHLLQHPDTYHQKIIRLRGTVTRLELHLDETNHFIDFVFFVQEEDQRVLVFGRHDRTKGDIQLTSDRTVEVQGLFWKERLANGHVLKNNLEAQAVWFYPPLIPDHAKHTSLDKNT
ncbi:MAG: hypothetical protein O2999_08815 [Nitrospirae bacterium]|nr:hypothetical protein [Nitrospirota bacterium]MDA1304384.1 hypothetical protein [Nitrospirota bacterium]